MDVTVTDVPERHRYEAAEDGSLAGFVTYRPGGDVITFLHTEVDPDHEGRGVGGQLARAALDDARARGLRVVPACPFVRAWIEGHPEYRDLVVTP